MPNSEIQYPISMHDMDKLMELIRTIEKRASSIEHGCKSPYGAYHALHPYSKDILDQCEEVYTVLRGAIRTTKNKIEQELKAENAQNG